MIIDSFPHVLKEWFPAGRIQGKEFTAGGLDGEQGHSLSIHIGNGKEQGMWKDFATGERGSDPISLYAAREGIGQAEAYDLLTKLFSSPYQPPEKKEKREAAEERWTQIPAHIDGEDTAPATLPNWKGKPTNRWDYLDEGGRLLFCVFRYDTDGEKTIRPLTYWTTTSGTPESQWRVKGWQKRPVPLYGLDRLAERPDAPVLLVEGEKAAGAASRLVPDMVGVTWCGGAERVSQADFTPLQGRTIYLLPDNDEPGKKAAHKIISLLEAGSTLFLVDIPEVLPEKGDIADLEAMGWTPDQTKEWRKTLIPPPEGDKEYSFDRWRMGTGKTITIRAYRKGRRVPDRSIARCNERGGKRDTGVCTSPSCIGSLSPDRGTLTSTETASSKGLPLFSSWQ